MENIFVGIDGNSLQRQIQFDVKIIFISQDFHF